MKPILSILPHFLCKTFFVISLKKLCKGPEHNSDAVDYKGYFFISYYLSRNLLFCLQKMHKKKQEMYRNPFPVLKYLLNRERIYGYHQDTFTMEKPFIGKLQNEVHCRCGTCYAIKVLRYIVMDCAGNILSICEECRDRILEDND